MLFSGYRSTTDVPGCVFLEKFIRWNPRVKVILTVRTSPSIWVRSLRQTVGSPPPWWIKLGRKVFRAIPWTTLYYHKYIAFVVNQEWTRHGLLPHSYTNILQLSDVELCQFYTRWIEYVRKLVPSEQLLVYNVRDGWKPLCTFLKAPLPGVQC